MVLNNHKGVKTLISVSIIYIFLAFNSNQDKISIDNEKHLLDSLINKWHKDVAEYNLNDYFSFMDSSFVFLGTAPEEYWPKNEFYEFCKPYFDKKSTWNFRPLTRHIYLNNNQNIAWFDETLYTWMEECRGTGVLIKRKNKWYLAHYSLSVLIENEKIKSFIKLRKKKLRTK